MSGAGDVGKTDSDSSVGRGSSSNLNCRGWVMASSQLVCNSAVLIANILADATDLASELSQEAKNAIWSIIARLTTMVKENEMSPSIFRFLVSILASKLDLIEDELLVCPLDHQSSGTKTDARVIADDMDQKINELTVDLERSNRKCEVYRTKLFSLLKDIDDHKQRLSIVVENIKLSMKDGV
ncbi:protein far1-related sequence 5 [Phtheirospermum japonicum]|uniref:Protein far1-related sequence 5 n=1 Tax=Phtheirospermum japonicum TaxID=374723 RepID=A0A830CG85_9LAMI|nr:protein far1-related sequence 5 [Phtheirospermum japonicum]